MEIRRQNGIVNVSGLEELRAANAREFRDAIFNALDSEVSQIEIDLSQTEFVDGGGLGALLSVYRGANKKNANGAVKLRLLNPQPPVRQMIELTQLRYVFEIVNEENEIEEQRLAA